MLAFSDRTETGISILTSAAGACLVAQLQLAFNTFVLSIFCLGLISRSALIYPICLPKFDGDRLYRDMNWERYQVLYSLKVGHSKGWFREKKWKRSKKQVYVELI